MGIPLGGIPTHLAEGAGHLRLRLSSLLVGTLVGLCISACATPTVRQAPDTRDFFRILRTPPEDARVRADLQGLANIHLYAPGAPISDLQLTIVRQHLWVASAGGQLCLAQPKGVACKPKEAATSEGVMLGTFQPPSERIPVPHEFRLQGVFPDNVSHILVVVGKGRRRAIGVHHNIVSMTEAKPIHVERLLRP